MPIVVNDLRDYLKWLEDQGKLIRVNKPLSPILEIPHFLRRIMYAKGPAVLFESIEGYPGWRIAGNIFPDLETFAKVLGVIKLEEIGERFTESISSAPPTRLREKISRLWEVKELASYLPKRVRKAGFQDNVIERDPLDKIPAFKTWPLDGGRYITLGLVVTRNPETGITNMGIYRVMIKDSHRAVIHWQIHKRGSHAFREAVERNEELPVAVVIGADPATIFTGVAPVPYPLDKLLFAGIVRGKGLEVVELENGLIVPANAEIVIEGRVQLSNLENEGPFGDHWGFYDMPIEKYPVLTVDRIYHRSNPIYIGTIVGLPPLEDAVVGKAVERVFLPIMKTIFPEIVDVSFPVHGVFQGLMIVSIKKKYPGHGKKIMMGLWGIGQTSLTKMIIVVDHFINPHDINQVIWAVTSFADPARDVVVLDNVHTDALDPTSKAHGIGAKLGIDATVKVEEESSREPPLIVSPDPDVERKIEELMLELGIRGDDPWRKVAREYTDTIRAWLGVRGSYTRYHD